MNIKRFRLLWMFILFCCEASVFASQQPPLKYAERFSYEIKNGITYITIPSAYLGSNNVLKYCLVPRELKKTSDTKGYQIIRTPVERVITLSTTMLPYLEELDKLDVLVAVDRAKYINTKSVLKLIEENKILEVGGSTNLNIELIYDLKPDLVLTYATGSKFDTHYKLNTANIPYVLTCSYLESSLLARCEWIKFFAMLLGVEGKANIYFDKIEKKYLFLKKKALLAKETPSVFCSAPYSGVWYMPGGKSWMANLFSDAKANYLWADNKKFTSQRLNFEKVIDKAIDADFWFCSSSLNWKTSKNILETDNRFKHFKAYKKKQVFINDKILNEFGGNDYYERGIVRPDLILQDYINIFHPKLLNNKKMTFYRHIQE